MAINKKILLVGDCNHQFIINLVKNIRIASLDKFIIDCLSITYVNEYNKNVYDFCYQKKTNSIFSFLIYKIPVVKYLYKFYQYKKLIERMPNYDFIHFHFIGIENIFIARLINKLYKNPIIIFSIWGSDLYKLNPCLYRSFNSVYNTADLITFANESTLSFFKHKFNWEKDNLLIRRFGLAPLEYLKTIDKSNFKCKSELGINPKKITITIGYNMAVNQQHIKIIRQLGKLNTSLYKDKIILLLPITYGGSEKYKKNIIKHLNQLPFKYIVFDSYLSDNDVAVIRKATDVMLQLQKTDQFSGSMQEHLYAHNIVITGSWLPYEILKHKKVWYYEISQIEDLLFILPTILDNIDLYNLKTRNNNNIIWQMSSWENNIKDWLTLYSYEKKITTDC